MTYLTQTFPSLVFIIIQGVFFLHFTLEPDIHKVGVGVTQSRNTTL